MQDLKPMGAVAALYSGDNRELSAAIIASLSQRIFKVGKIRPAGWLRTAMARLSHRILKWTTRSSSSTDAHGVETTVFSNRLMERSRHPYAKSLLTSSCVDFVSLVEGGDSMNGPYMMLSPEIKKNSDVWDRLFLDSIQGRDVQSRIIWETQATYEAAKLRLNRGEPVRMKAVAAGTGLSMMLVYDRLVRDGFNPELITARITDRDAVSIEKANRLLDTLAGTWNPRPGFNWRHGITAVVEDLFASENPTGSAAGERYHIVTAIGILEYFQGSSYATTEQRLGPVQALDEVTAYHLVERLADMTTDDARLIVNSYRKHVSTRILELFGKRFDYRREEDLSTLLASVNFRPTQMVGSGNIYDVQVYQRNAPDAGSVAATASSSGQK